MADNTEKKKWDMKPRSSFEAAIEWFRKQSDSIVVVAIRADGGAVARHDHCSPTDAIMLIQKAFPKMIASMESLDSEKRRRQPNS